MAPADAPRDPIAVLGTGSIGSAVARRLLAGGHEVVVWNRTADRAAALVAAGARPAGSAPAAVSAGALTLVAVSDDAAVQACLGALDGDLVGRTIAVLGTGTAEGARLAARRVEGLGARHLAVGVQATPVTIGTEAATLLVSGSPDAFARHRSVLGLLGRPRFVGRAPEAAAVWDLALFGLWYDAQLGLLRALDAARTAGLDVAAFAETAAGQLGHVLTALPGTVAEVLAGEHPRGPADLVEHLAVLRRLVDLRAGRPLGDGGLAAVASTVEALVADGRGGEGLSATVG